MSFESGDGLSGQPGEFSGARSLRDERAIGIEEDREVIGPRRGEIGHLVEAFDDCVWDSFQMMT
jgi:hypothetical protein